MDRKLFLSRLEQEVLIFSGVLGELKRSGLLTTHSPPEKLSIEMPHLLFDAFRKYIKAGVDILIATTSGANRANLNLYGLSDKTREINLNGINVAKQAAGGRAWVAGAVGPIFRHKAPFDEMAFNDVLDLFREQVVALCEGKPDLLILDNFTNIREMKAALVAISENFEGAVVSLLKFEQNGITRNGIDLFSAINTLDLIDFDVFGINIANMTHLDARDDLSIRFCRKPLLFSFDSFIEEIKNQKSKVDEMLKRSTVLLLEQGFAIIGGIDEITPAQVTEIALLSKHQKPTKSISRKRTNLASRLKSIYIEPEFPHVYIGDLSVSGANIEAGTWQNSELKAELFKNAFNFVQSGIDVIKLDFSEFRGDEIPILQDTIAAIQDELDVVFYIESSNFDAIKAGLQSVEGKPVVKLSGADENDLTLVYPLVKQYGAVLIFELPKPECNDRQFAACESLIHRVRAMAADAGLPENNVFFECYFQGETDFSIRAAAILDFITFLQSRFSLKIVLELTRAFEDVSYNTCDLNNFIQRAHSRGLALTVLTSMDLGLLHSVGLCNQTTS